MVKVYQYHKSWPEGSLKIGGTMAAESLLLFLLLFLLLWVLKFALLAKIILHRQFSVALAGLGEAL